MENNVDLIKETRELNTAISDLLMEFNSKTYLLVKSLDIHYTEMSSKLGCDYIIQVTSNIPIT